MIVNILGFLANLTSLILWIPQARTTWENRNSFGALSGISLITQLLVVTNTILWCVYGLMINNFWLPLGTIIILPLACFTIFIKYKISKENRNVEIDGNRWFDFEMYKTLDSDCKKKCLVAIYMTDFHEQMIYEYLNPFSYEEMSDLDKMYWDRDLWVKSIEGGVE